MSQLPRTVATSSNWYLQPKGPSQRGDAVAAGLSLYARLLCSMPEFQAFPGTDVEIRDARGPHPLVFGADEEGEALRTLAPGVFAGGGGTPVMCSFGQFTSVILEALARLPFAGGPAADRYLGTHRCATVFLRRVWSTALAVVGRMSESNRLAFWSPEQRGPFVVRLAALRKSATPAELNAFYVMDAGPEPVGVDPAASVQPESAGMPMGWQNAKVDLVEDDDESEADSGMEEMVEDSSDDCMSDTMRPAGQQTHFN